MRKYLIILAVSIFLSAESAVAANFALVEENHAKIEKDGVTYIFDSYIIPLRQPYYCTVMVIT